MVSFVENLKAAADTGDAAAQYELGMLYAFGDIFTMPIFPGVICSNFLVGIIILSLFAIISPPS